MYPFDPVADSTAKTSQNSEEIRARPALPPAEEQNMNIVTVEAAAALDLAALPPGIALDPDESLPMAWRLRGAGEPAAAAYIHGPKASVLEEPPPPNAEPPEPPEAVDEKLTERQLAFCERYVECPVASRAAREAGYAPATAADQASRLLKHPRIMRRIIELRRKRQLELAFRREALLDKFEAVFAEAIERKEFYAAIQALTMQARLAHIPEAMPGFRYVHRERNAGEHMVWDAVGRLEQKLCEIAVGDFPGAAASVPSPRPAARPATPVPPSPRARKQR